MIRAGPVPREGIQSRGEDPQVETRPGEEGLWAADWVAQPWGPTQGRQDSGQLEDHWDKQEGCGKPGLQACTSTGWPTPEARWREQTKDGGDLDLRLLPRRGKRNNCWSLHRRCFKVRPLSVADRSQEPPWDPQLQHCSSLGQGSQCQEPGKHTLKGKELVPAWPSGLQLYNVGSDPAPVRVATATEQWGNPTSHLAPALASPSPAPTPAKDRGVSTAKFLSMSNSDLPQKALGAHSLPREAPT